MTETILPRLRQVHPDGDFFIGQDNGIYWALTDPPLQGCKSPDWYYVPGVPQLLDGEMRRSYVLWKEKVRPYLILEYASEDGAEERDRTPNTGKFWVYERHIRPAYYGIFEPDLGRIEMYQLVEDHFELFPANERGRFPFSELSLELGIWHGRHGGYDLGWMRWWDSRGNLLPTGQESAERLREQLRSLGVDPGEA